jgi:hypothetical protein
MEQIKKMGIRKSTNDNISCQKTGEGRRRADGTWLLIKTPCSTHNWDRKKRKWETPGTARRN